MLLTKTFSWEQMQILPLVPVLTGNSWKIFLRPCHQNDADPTSQQHLKQPWSSTACENFLETRLVNYDSHYYTFCYAVYETATV